MDLSDLARLVIPGIVLVLWALNQLFGKEEANAQARAAKILPKPGNLPPAPRPRVRQGGAAPGAVSQPAKAWSNGFDPVRPPVPTTSGVNPREEVLIIGPESGRPGGNRRGGQQSGGKRGQRGKSAPAAERKGESKSLVAPLDRAMSSSPLSRPGEVRLTDQAPKLEETMAPVAGFDFSGAFNSPQRLREAFILQIALGPPKALQNRRGR